MVTLNDVFSNRTAYTLRLIVTEGTVDVVNNRSEADWSLRIVETSEYGSWSNSALTWSVNIGGQTASGSDTYDFRNYDSLILGSGTFWITHNSDGTKTISVSGSAGGGTTIGSASVSGSLALTDIPRASTPTFSPTSPDAGTSVTINTNRASSSFTHTIEYNIGSTGWVTIGTGIGASTSWSIPLSLLNEFPNSATGAVSIRTKTYNGASLIGTTTKTLNVKAPTSIVPDFGTVTHSEATTSPNVASLVGAYVQNVSKLALAITSAVGAYGSTITGYKIEVMSGSTVLQTINAVSGTTPVPVSASGTITLRGTVTDSRGRTHSEDVTTTFLAYAPPVITSLSLERALSSGVPDDEGTYIRMNLNASVSSLVNGTQKNELHYRMKTRDAGGSTWTTTAFDVDTNALTFNSYDKAGTYAVSDSFDVLIEVYDIFTTSAVQGAVPVAAVFMHWDGSDGVGILKYRENGALDVGGRVFSKAAGVSGQVEPTGCMVMWPINTAPDGWLLCDGSAVSRTTYADLFAILGTTYGTGDGSTTFNLPNFKGRTPVGRDSGQTEFDTIGETGGAKTHTLTTAQLPSHTHPAAGGFEFLEITSGSNAVINTTQRAFPATGSSAYYMYADGPDTLVEEAATGSAGSGSAHNNLQPYLTVNMIIKI